MKVGDLVRRHSTGTNHKVTEVLPSGKIRLDGAIKRKHFSEKFTILTPSEALEATLLGSIGHNTPYQGILRQLAGVPLN
jgi:hypothetical protein